MKRASLKSVNVSVLANPSPDVTDRILKTEGDSAPRKPRSSDKPRSRAWAASPSPTSAGPQPAAPSAADSQPADALITAALTQTRLALEALQTARASAPAQYSLGVRCRLDALAHHLEQVAQFVTGQRP